MLTKMTDADWVTVLRVFLCESGKNLTTRLFQTNSTALRRTSSETSQ